jgi:AcrR family transcriptional regulator
MQTSKKIRRRRSPEEAREELLDAAERLLWARGPETVGLKDIAAEIGVTHGLVVHYFGSYAGVVRAVLARHQQRAAVETFAHLMEAQETLDFEALGRRVFAFVADPQRARLAVWLSFQKEDTAHGEALPRGAMLRQLVNVVEQLLPEMRQRQGKTPVSREVIERVVLMVLVAGQGYALQGASRWRALGREPSPELDETFFRMLWDMVEHHLDASAVQGKPAGSEAATSLAGPPAGGSSRRGA